MSCLGIGESATKSIMSQVLAAIEFMHSENLVHRNLKAENVLIFDANFSKVSTIRSFKFVIVYMGFRNKECC